MRQPKALMGEVSFYALIQHPIVDPCSENCPCMMCYRQKLCTPRIKHSVPDLEHYSRISLVAWKKRDLSWGNRSSKVSLTLLPPVQQAKVSASPSLLYRHAPALPQPVGSLLLMTNSVPATHSYRRSKLSNNPSQKNVVAFRSRGFGRWHARKQIRVQPRMRKVGI